MGTFYSGREGSLLIGDTTAAKVLNWSLTGQVDLLETTTLADAQPTFAPGLQNYEGEAGLIYYKQDDGTNNAATLLQKVFKTAAPNTSDLVTLTLRFVDGLQNKDLTFNAYITNASMGLSVGEIVKTQIQFRVTGALTTVTI